MSGTERPTSARRPSPASPDRPQQEQLRAAVGEHDPGDHGNEDPAKELGRLGDLDARAEMFQSCDRRGCSSAAA
eukprot:2207769-Alexandrium_andersonii.AAC.1